MEDLTRGVEVFVAINLIALGLSYVLQPAAWKAFLTHLQSKGAAGSFTIAGIGLVLGSFIVAFHNIWGGWPTVVTVFGWGSLAKGTAYLVFPNLGRKGLEMGLRLPSWYWRTSGAVAVVLGIAILRYALA